MNTTRKKRLLTGLVGMTLFLMLVMCGSVMAAEEPFTVEKDGFVYKVYTDGSPNLHSVFVSEYKGSSESVEFPTPTSLEIDGETYTAIEETEFMVGNGNTPVLSSNNVKKVAIPNGYTAISDSAFSGCSSLTEIAIAGSMERICTDAFAGCSDLTNYYIDGNPSFYGDPRIAQGSDGSANNKQVTVYIKSGTGNDNDNHVKDYVNTTNTTQNRTGTNTEILLMTADNPYSMSTVQPGDGQSGSNNNNNNNNDNNSNSNNNNNSNDSNNNNNNNDNNSNNPTNTNTTGTGSDQGSGNVQVVATQMGEDGTPLGKGASAAAAEECLINYSKETDPAGSVFSVLQLKVSKVTKDSLKLTWKKAPGASKYLVFGNKCGKANHYEKQTETTATSLTVKKIGKNKIAKGTYYKFIVVAVDGSGTIVSTSKTVHGATSGGKNGNDKKVTTNAKKNKVSLKVKKKFKLKAKPVPASSTLKVSRHRGMVYESSNPNVATVSKKGVIKGVAKGNCFVYAYTQNGVMAKVKVTVK